MIPTNSWRRHGKIEQHAENLQATSSTQADPTRTCPKESLHSNIVWRAGTVWCIDYLTVRMDTDGSESKASKASKLINHKGIYRESDTDDRCKTSKNLLAIAVVVRRQPQYACSYAWNAHGQGYKEHLLQEQQNTNAGMNACIFPRNHPSRFAFCRWSGSCFQSSENSTWNAKVPPWFYLDYSFNYSECKFGFAMR